MGGVGFRKVAITIAALVTGATGVVVAQPAKAEPVPVNGNPTPLTDLFASTVLPPLTGGTERICAKSKLGIRVHCMEHLNVQPSLVPASGTTFGHWVYCRDVCTGRLLVHEMVHVHQFERHGDLFGPMYLAEAAVNGTGCANKYERPAYEASGGCP